MREDEVLEILHDYFHGNLSQKELASKYRKSLRDINNLIKSYKALLQQSMSVPSAGHPASQQNLQVNRRKVAEVVADFLEDLDDLIARRVEHLLNTGLIHYGSNNLRLDGSNNLRLGLTYFAQARDLLAQALVMIRSEDFTGLIGKAVDFESTIRWKIRACRRTCRESTWPP